MKRQNFLRFFVVIALAIVTAALVVTGCGESAKWKLTWDIDEHAQVTVEGHDGLPEGAADNEVITFSVQGKDGYAVAKVTRNGRVISAANGKYSLTVTADTTVKVETEPAVKGVKVTKNPTKLTYYAGEQLDRTGMEVSIEYETGATEPTTAYTVVYAGGNNAAAFGLGDTSFSVRYGETVSDPVNLDGAVVALVTIDTVGAKVSSSYMESLNTNAELSNVAESNGVITFTFAKALTKAVALPTVGDLQKGEEEGDYTFLGWSDGSAQVTEIMAASDKSANFTAAWNAKLLEIESVKLELKEGIPYLVVTGKFKAAESVNLYLYEGNAKVEFVGPEFKGKRSDPFTLEFNLQDISKSDKSADYLGKWMDLKFQAKTAGASQADTQEINLADYPADFMDRNQTIHDSEYTYSFPVYTPDGSDASKEAYLKVQFQKYIAQVYEYAIRAGEMDENGDPTVIFSGKVLDSQYYGKAIRIDFWVSTTVDCVGAIGADGSFSITVPLTASNFPLNTDGYAHCRIVNAVDDLTAVWSYDNDSNLQNNWCSNLGDLSKDYTGIGLISGGAVRVANADESRVYYVGEGTWGGVVVRGVNELIKFTLAQKCDPELKVDSMTNATKVFYVITVDVTGTLSEADAKQLRFGNIDNSDEKETWTIPLDHFEDLGNGVYRLFFDVTSSEKSENAGLWAAVYFGETSDGKVLEVNENDNPGTSVDGLYAIAGGKKYYIWCKNGDPDNTWNRANLKVEATTETENPESADPTKWNYNASEQPAPTTPAITAVGLETDNAENPTKVFYVLTINAVGFTEADLQTAKFGDQLGTENEVSYKLEKVEKVEGNVYKLYFDVTDARSSAGGEWIWPHLTIKGKGLDGSDNTDVKGAFASANGISVTVGSKQYSIKYDGETWEMPVCVVKDI